MPVSVHGFVSGQPSVFLRTGVLGPAFV